MALNPEGVGRSDRTMRRLAIVGFAGLVACVIVRAPTLLPPETELPILKVKLALNAGWILVFGPVVVTLALVYAVLRIVGRAAIHRMLAIVAFALPPLTVAFLSLQFFLLLAPPGQCNAFTRSRLLSDLSLDAFRPEYCMGVASGVQERMPWLLQPPILEGWSQASLPVVALVLSLWGWRRWMALTPV